MKSARHSKVDWWIGGAFLIGLGAVAIDSQATITGLLIGVLGILVVIMGWRHPTRSELARQRLDQLREAAATLCHNLPSGIMLIDKNDRVLFANNEALRLFGGKAEDFKGRSLASWSDTKPTETKPGLLPAHCFRRGDGTLFYAHISEAPVELSGELAMPGLRILIVSDITTLVDTQQRMQQAERLRTAASMANQFAHEVRNPVAAISGSAQVLGKLQRQLVDHGSHHSVSDSDREVLYQCIVHESDRLDGIIAKFLSVTESSDDRLGKILQESEMGGGTDRSLGTSTVSRQPEPSHVA